MRQAVSPVLEASRLLLVPLLILLISNHALATQAQLWSDDSGVTRQGRTILAGTPPVVPPSLQMCSGLTTHHDRVEIKPVARPPFMTAFKEPAFATRVTRVTDSKADMVYKPAGAPMQAWNSDESLLLLHRYQDEQHDVVLHHGHDYRELDVLELPVAGSDTVHWSHSDPDRLFLVAQSGPDAGQLAEYDVKTRLQTPLANIADACLDHGQGVDGGHLARPSVDDDVFVFRCGRAPDGASAVVSYRRSSDTLHSLAIDADSAWPASERPHVLPSGKRIWLAGQFFDESLLPTDQQVDMADTDRPVSVGQTHQGHDAVYQSPSAVSPGGCDRDGWRGLGLLVEHRLDTGECRTVINQSDGYPQLPGTELFASAYQRPQWLAIATSGNDDVEPFLARQQAPLLFSEVAIVDSTPGVRDVCRLAHHRSFGAQAGKGAYPAELGEPSVVQSPTGTRVLFASDWYDSGLVDSYVIELPAFTPHDLAGQWIDRGEPRVITELAQAGAQFNVQRTFSSATDEERRYASGSGRIDGHQVQLSYTLLLNDEREIPVDCEGEITQNSEIALLCRDHHFGRRSLLWQRP